MNNPLRFEGKVAIVTGAGSGGGRATAHRLAKEGAAVVLADINLQTAEEAAGEIRTRGREALAALCDVGQERDVAALMETTVAAFGRIDVLHNNAADLSPRTLGQDKLIHEMSVEVWDRSLATDLRGPMLGCKHAIPVMLNHGGGAIVNTTSTAGLTGDTSKTAYGAAKAGLILLTKNVATMYGKQGIRCNAIAPGLMLSPAANYLSDENLFDFWCERLVPEAGRPEDMAALVAFLASDEARYITGQTIVFDGGMVSHRPSYSLDLWREHSETKGVGNADT